MINGITLKNGNRGYRITSTIPNLPTSLKPSDSEFVEICFTGGDTSFFKDSLTILTDCFTDYLSISTKPQTPLIYASGCYFYHF